MPWYSFGRRIFFSRRFHVTLPEDQASSRRGKLIGSEKGPYVVVAGCVFVWMVVSICQFC